MKKIIRLLIISLCLIALTLILIQLGLETFETWEVEEVVEVNGEPVYDGLGNLVYETYTESNIGFIFYGAAAVSGISGLCSVGVVIYHWYEKDYDW